VLSTLPSGWRNNPSAAQRASYEAGGEHPAEVRYQFGRDGLSAEADGVPVPGLRLHEATPCRVDLEAGGVRRVVAVHRVGRVSYVDSALGHSALAEVDRFPDPAGAEQAGSLLAPMPGTVVRIEVGVGDPVSAGMSILAIEAMKMEHVIRAPAAGVVAELLVTVGAQVSSGSVLAVVTEEGGRDE
jgi:propionyl-CoA carboxylase alpha chain